MKLEKLFTAEREAEIAAEMKHMYWDLDMTQAQIREHFQLTHDTFNEFRDKYGLRKTNDQYNKKNIDKRFTKEQLDAMAENIRREFLEELKPLDELQAKYDLTWSEMQSLKNRYGIKETPEQHWERTQRANERIHGVRHMSHIEGHNAKVRTSLHSRLGHVPLYQGLLLN